jgi:predicted ATPase
MRETLAQSAPETQCESGTALVSAILETAPNVVIVVTSRVQLHLEGERLLPIGGMAYPTVQADAHKDALRYDAVRLFLESARWVQPGFEIKADNAMDIARICQLVAGMPLGLRLAAAWVEMLPLSDIAAEISQSLDLLETELRDVPQRQRSMKAVFDHSWRLLRAHEREFLKGLSVFRGGFTHRAAQRVTGASLRDLKGLMDKSLLQRAPSSSTQGSEIASRRYELHELLRQYAAGKLGRSPITAQAARDRHCAYYVGFLERRGIELRGPRQAEALGEIEADSENVRSAWNWAVERDQVERLDRATDGLCLFYDWRGRYQEGGAACQSATASLSAAHDEVGARVLAKILARQGVFDFVLGQNEAAARQLEHSLAILDGPQLVGENARSEKAFALLRTGDVLIGTNRSKARRLYEQSLALYQGLGDRWGEAAVLSNLASLAWSMGAHDEATRLVEESLVLWRGLGDQRRLAASFRTLGVITLYQGKLDQSEKVLRTSLSISRDLGDQAGIAGGLVNLSSALFWAGRYRECYALTQKGVAMRKDLGTLDAWALSNGILGCIEMMLGHYETARDLLQSAMNVAQECSFLRGIAFSLHWLGQTTLATGEYGAAQEMFRESIAIYREIEQQDELGWAYTGLGSAARGLGELFEARQKLYEALRIGVRIRSFILLMLALPATALLLAEQDECERAVELYALASRYPAVANSRWYEDVAGKPIAAVGADLPQEVVIAARERGCVLDLWATATELLADLEGQA